MISPEDTVGSRIRQARVLANMKQSELGKKLSVSGSLIGQWETSVRNPKDESLRKISDILNVPVKFLKAESPFDSMEMLNMKKESILEMLSNAGLFSFDGRTVSEVPEPEYWRLYDRHITCYREPETDSEEYEAGLKVLDAIHREEYQSLKKSILREMPEEFIQIYGTLNQAGKDEALKRISELAELPRYRKES